MAAIIDASSSSTESVTPFGSETFALSPDAAPSPTAIIDRSIGGSLKPLGLRSPSAIRAARASMTGMNVDTFAGAEGATKAGAFDWRCLRIQVRSRLALIPFSSASFDIETPGIRQASNNLAFDAGSNSRLLSRTPCGIPLVSWHHCKRDFWVTYESGERLGRLCPQAT